MSLGKSLPPANILKSKSILQDKTPIVIYRLVFYFTIIKFFNSKRDGENLTKKL